MSAQKNDATVVLQGLHLCYEGQTWMTLEVNKASARDGIIALKNQQQGLVLKAKEILEKLTELQNYRTNNFSIAEIATECEAEFGVYVRVLKDVLTGSRPFQKSVAEEMTASQQRQIQHYNQLFAAVVYETEKEKLEPMQSRLRTQLNRVKLDNAAYNSPNYPPQPNPPSASLVSPSPNSPFASQNSPFTAIPAANNQNVLPRKSNSARSASGPPSRGLVLPPFPQQNQNNNNNNNTQFNHNNRNSITVQSNGGVGITCQLCRKQGHSAKACPSNTSASSTQCQLCGFFGHEATSCPSLLPAPPPPSQNNNNNNHTPSNAPLNNNTTNHSNNNSNNNNNNNNNDFKDFELAPLDASAPLAPIIDLKKMENRLKDQGVEVLKMVKEFIRVAESEGTEEELSNKVIELMRSVNELMNKGLEVVSTDWINLLVEDEFAVREGVFKMVGAAMEKKFKRIGESAEMKEELEKIITQLTTALKNFIVSSEIFVEAK